MRLFQGRAVRTLVARELRAYFESPSAYVALFVFYLILGYLFAAPLFLVGQSSIKSMTDYGPLLLAFFVPALTMGLLAEELKSGTFESLATLPLEDWDIVLGKYLGFAVLHACAVAGLLFYPVVVGVLSSSGLDWGETFGVLASLLLLGWTFGAIGLFASSLGKNQIVAFVTSFLFCFAAFAAGKLATLAPAGLSPLFEWIGVDSHVATLSKGVLDTRDLLYFASATFAFLYLAVHRLQGRKA
jgi:ABC-2 type transport system permease protein